MLFMFMGLLIVIIVIAMSRNVISHIVCMFYSLCKVIAIIETSKFLYFSDIAIIISVYSNMFINYYATNTNMICLF